MRGATDHYDDLDQSPIATLERWERHGAIWQVTSRSRAEATVELRTCHGELVDEFRFGDPRTLRYLAARPRSDIDPDSSGGVM